MKNLKNLLFFILSVLIVSTGYAWNGKTVTWASGYQRNIYFEYAENTANWLKSLAYVYYPGLYRWPESEEEHRAFGAGMDTGTAGVGLFFLEMYNLTKDEEYREYAECAGNYLTGRIFGRGRGDWLSGAAGVGYYLIELWKATGNALYLDKAKELGNRLIEQSVSSYGGYYWWTNIDVLRIYSGYGYGVAGIGDFFARLYDVTQDPLYLEYAMGAGFWLLSSGREPVPGQYCWPALIDDTGVNITWRDGSVGIILFLLKLYDSTGLNIYLNFAIGGTDWLAARAVSAGEGTYKWNDGTGSESYPFTYSEGAPGVVHVLYEMHRRTGNSGYLEYARGGAGWIRQEAEEVSPHIYRWPQTEGYSHDTGLLTGTAGVGNSFNLYYSYDPDTVYLEYARGAAQWLMSAAEFDSPEQNKWLNYMDEFNVDYGGKKHETGWYSGAAGIGLFFLRLSQTLPAPSTGNQPPVLNPLDNKDITVGETVEFPVSGRDPDQGPQPLMLIASYLPAGASFIDNHFSWTPGNDQAGTYDIYFTAADGWEADREHVVINVKKIKKARIGR